MGIRYERKGRKITNGPVIFIPMFDNESEVVDTINDSIESKLSFYAFSYPYQENVTIGVSEGVEFGLCNPGFVIGSFNPDFQYISIPFNYTGNKKNLSLLYELPETSTSFEEYKNEIEDIKKLIDNKELDKVVSARVLKIIGTVDVGKTFDKLRKKHKGSFVFCFYTPVTGLWIGASPELLLKNKDGILTSMALAGTLPVSSTLDWDEKNIYEQEIVIQFIENIFSSFSNKVNIEEKRELTAGNVKHLCNIIESKIEPRFNNVDSINKILHKLSPTPALCGYPKNRALEFILNHESFSRGFYGGFCGPFNSPENFYFNVGIRCACITSEAVYLFAGGGITGLSDPFDEWAETDHKLELMTECIEYTNK